MIVNHPLYAEMLANHAACLRVGTPVDQIPDIEAQLSQAPIVIDKYKLLHDQLVDITQNEQMDLDRCMVNSLAFCFKCQDISLPLQWNLKGIKAIEMNYSISVEFFSSCFCC